MTPKHFLNGRNRTKFENRKNVEIPGNSVKRGHFRPSKCLKLVILQDIDFKFCTHIHLIGFFHIYSGFLKIRNFSLIFLNNTYYWLFSKIQKNELKIWDSSLIAPFLLNLLLKTIWFYLFSRLRGKVFRKPSFLPKTGKTLRHSDVICGRRIWCIEFSFCQDVQNW